MNTLNTRDLGTCLFRVLCRCIPVIRRVSKITSPHLLFPTYFTLILLVKLNIRPFGTSRNIETKNTRIVDEIKDILLICVPEIKIKETVRT